MEREKQTSANATKFEPPTTQPSSEKRAPRSRLRLPIIDADGPSPAEVRRMILNEHAQIRGLLSALETEATSLLAMSAPSEAASRATRALARELCETMAIHVARENRLLVPVLTLLDVWGPVRAQQLVDEHTRQLMLLHAYGDMLGGEEITPQVLALTAWQLVRSINADMEMEEATILSAELLADDGIVTDVESG